MDASAYSLKGRVAIVTGASRGIGKAIALSLAGAGADIAAVDIATGPLAQTAQELQALGRVVLDIQADVTREEDVPRAVQQVSSRFGRIDILCNNAGIVMSKPVAVTPDMKYPSWLERPAGGDFEPLSIQEWHRVLDTNLTSAFLFAREVGPHMIAQRSGKVINISSTSAFKGTPYYSAYCVSKAGLSSLTRCLASEWAQFNINVNAIAPGTVNTDMTTPSMANPDMKKLMLDAVPLGRLAEASEVAALALFLASDASAYVTGQTFTIDGGQLGRGPGI